jgi:hypothetical protein
MAVPLTVDAVVPMTGFMTKAIFLRGQSAAELELRLGYAPARLSGGYWLLFLEKMPTPADFEFMGYSQMAGGVPLGHLHPAGGLTAEQSLGTQGFDMTRLKDRVIRETFRLAGPHRLAKVLPLDPAAGPMPYPPGSGIPQWKIIGAGLPFRVVQRIGPGEVYSGDYI